MLQQNQSALNLFALHLLRQQLLSDPYQYPLFIPYNTSVRGNRVSISSRRVVLETSTNTNTDHLHPSACSLIPHSPLLHTSDSASCITLAGFECRAQSFWKEAGRETASLCTLNAEPFAKNDSFQYPHQVESIEAGVRKAQTTDEAGFAQGRPWDPYYGHIYDDIKNCLTISDAGLLQQSCSCNTTPKRPHSRSTVVRRSNSKIPKLMTR